MRPLPASGCIMGQAIRTPATRFFLALATVMFGAASPVRAAPALGDTNSKSPQ
jgi:hypothetical protein